MLTGVSIALGLAACGAMPSSGDPQAFTIEAPNAEPIHPSGFGPQEDSSPEQLVRDFLRACAAGSSDNYDTARQYLMPMVATVWKPEARVLVYPNDEIPKANSSAPAGGKTQVTLETRVRASVDQQGIFADAGGAPAQVVFEMSRDTSGQWRISSLDDGVILAQSSFVGAFQSAQLYFLSLDRQGLVADPRWYPRNRLASHLMNGLSAGPSEELSPGVYTALDPTLTLPTQGVELDDQTIQVDLVGPMPSTLEERFRLSWQVNATLSQVRNATKIQIRINSVELDPVAPTMGVNLVLDIAMGVREGQIVDSDGDTWQRSIGSDIVGPNPSFPARGPVEDYTAAWINDGDQLAVLPSDGQVSRLPLEGLSPPSVDRWGWVWTSGQASLLTIVNGRGAPIDMELPGALHSDVRKLAVSPDGTRLALMARDSEGAKLWIGTISRDESGRPLRISQVNPLPQAGSDLLDMSWSGGVTLVVLRSAGDADTELLVVPLGDFTQLSKVQTGMDRVTAGSQTSRVYLQNEEMELYDRRGALWRPLGSDVAYVRFPG